MKINDWTKKVHNTAKEKGWWDSPRTENEICQLFITEIAEASEEARKPNLPPIYQTESAAITDIMRVHTSPNWDSALKPEGEAIEMADLLIRLGDWIGHNNWDLGKMVVPLANHDPTFKETIDKLAELHGEDPIQFQSPLDSHFRLVRAIVAAQAEKPEIGWMGWDSSPKAVIYAEVFMLAMLYMIHRGWDIEAALEAKMAYNEKRPYRHGNKLA
jgi:hypothetical protein